MNVCNGRAAHFLHVYLHGSNLKLAESVPVEGASLDMRQGISIPPETGLASSLGFPGDSSDNAISNDASCAASRESCGCFC